MHLPIASLIHSYGYYVLFLLVALESLGIPLPGETALVTAAAAAALGGLSIVGVIAVAAAAAIIGDNIGYWIGREGGLALVRRFGARLHLDTGKVERVRGYFVRHGAKTVFFGRFIALLRTWAAVMAGVGCMRYRTFMFWNALGGVVWASVVGVLGYIFGRDLPALERHLSRASWALVALVVAGGVVLLVLRSRRKGCRGGRGGGRFRDRPRPGAAP
jgi:membrane protein DedA with SNARE-associated domain